VLDLVRLIPLEEGDRPHELKVEPLYLTRPAPEGSGRLPVP
jgi:hypothetical protein